MDIAGKHILVIGLKRTGVSLVRCLAEHGALVHVTDRQSRQALQAELASLARLSYEWRSEANPEAMLHGIDVVVPSPGVPLSAPLLQTAIQFGIPVWSEIELAARLLSCPLLAVTGTNGKSTTTSLIAAMIQASGQRVFVGGNLGVPLSEAVGQGFQVAVVEVSSFQLEWVEQFRPLIGVFLNLSEDHLDRHGSLAEYGRTKRALFTQQRTTDWAVVNRDDPEVNALVKDLSSQLHSFGWSRVADHVSQATWIETNRLVVRSHGQENRHALDRLQLYGRHNLENVMAAVSAATLWGVPSAVIDEALATFTGLPHRLERVATKRGVTYFDDSKGTNVGAVVQSLASFPGAVILLAGGVDKGGDYEPLRAAVRSKVKTLILFGRDRAKMQAALGKEATTVLVETLPEAVQEAAGRAQAGDTVLLSPACASFDQFQDYAHRGRVFRSCVEAL